MASSAALAGERRRSYRLEGAIETAMKAGVALKDVDQVTDDPEPLVERARIRRHRRHKAVDEVDNGVDERHLLERSAGLRAECVWIPRSAPYAWAVLGVGAERLKRRRQVVEGVIDGSSPITETHCFGAEAPGPDLRVRAAQSVHDCGELILVRDLIAAKPAHADWVAAANNGLRRSPAAPDRRNFGR